MIRKCLFFFIARLPEIVNKIYFSALPASCFQQTADRLASAIYVKRLF